MSTLARAHSPEGLVLSDLDESALEPQLHNVGREIDDGVQFAATAPAFEPNAPRFEGFFKPAFGASAHVHASEALAIGVAPTLEESDHLEVVLPVFAETSFGPLSLSIEAAYHIIRDGDEVTLDIGLELPLWRELSMLALLKGAATPTLQDRSLRAAAGFSWKSSDTVSILALTGDAIRDIPFESSEHLVMLATRATW